MQSELPSGATLIDRLPDDEYNIVRKLQSQSWSHVCMTYENQEYGRNFRFDNPLYAELDGVYYVYSTFSGWDWQGYHGQTTDFLNLEHCRRVFLENYSDRYVETIISAAVKKQL